MEEQIDYSIKQQEDEARLKALAKAYADVASSLGKWTPESVRYTTSPCEEETFYGKLCSTCTFYSKFKCKIVEGDIHPQAVCNKWISGIPDAVETWKDEVAEMLSDTQTEEEPDTNSSQIIEQPTEVQDLSQDSTETIISEQKPIIEEDIQKFSDWQEPCLEPLLLSDSLVRVPIAKLGSFHHKKYGVVKFTDNDFEEIKRNFDDSVLGFRPYPTYGHPIGDDPKLPAVDDQLKKGEAVAIEQRGDILYAVTKPNDETAKLIENQEYEYASGEFIRGYVDKNTGQTRGTVLARYALTNSPFIPFEDTKIESLSDSQCPQNKTYFMVKLTDDSHNNTINSMEDALETQVSAEQVSTPSPQEAAPAALNLKAVIEEATNSIKESYEKKYESLESSFAQVKDVYQSQVNSLTEELNGLRARFVQTEAQAQMLSQTHSSAQKTANYNSLASAGVSPVLIQKFSTIESALEGGQSVIKLSDSEGKETETPIIGLVQDMLLEAVGTKIETQQLGQSFNQSSLDAQLKNLTQSYRAKKTQLVK